MEKPPLVFVLWNDSQDHPEKWVDESAAQAFGDVPCTISSIGYQVSKTEKYITIAGDWDATDKDFGQVTKIPMGMIVSITEIPDVRTVPE